MPSRNGAQGSRSFTVKTTKFIDTEHELLIYLNELEMKLERLQNKVSTLNFQRYIDKQNNPEILELAQELSKIMLDPELHDQIAFWQGQVKDPILSRRLDVWSDSLLLAKVESKPEIVELQQKVAYQVMSHGYLVGGKRISLGEVRAIVRANPDKKAREAAWRSHNELNRIVSKEMLKLFRLRNKAAQELGFETYVDLRLEKNGQMSRERVETLLTELTTATQDFYKELIEKGAEKLGIETIEPWDVQYILEQQGGIPKAYFPKDRLNASLEQWAQHMGFSIDDYGIEPVFVDIPYNGLTMGLERDKIKILANPDDGYTYYRTHFHELGHALHSALKEIDHYILRRESSIFNEGMAELFGYISSDKSWLTDFYGLDEATAQKALESAVGPKFHYIRQRTAYCLFEYQAYQDLDQDLDELMAKIEQDVLHCTFDSTARWASNGWYVSYPVYWQNYVLADFVASQINHHLQREIGSLTSDRAAFDYVVEHYIKHGALVPWLDKVLLGTGKELDSEAVIADLLQ